jgi:hypothetical protein
MTYSVELSIEHACRMICELLECRERLLKHLAKCDPAAYEIERERADLWDFKFRYYYNSYDVFIGQDFTNN